MAPDSVSSTTVNNIILLKNARDIAAVFQRAGVPLIVLKGAALLETVYADLSIRPMADIDLLIREKDYFRAHKLVSGLDFIQQQGTTFPAYAKKQSGFDVEVEMHTKLMYAPEKEIWQDPMRFSLDGQEAYTLSLEQNLIYLCYHYAVCHTTHDPKGIRDIALLVQAHKGVVKWDDLISKIKRYRLQAPCYYTFARVKENFCPAIPDDFVAKIKPGVSLQSALLKKIFAGKVKMPNTAYILELLIDPRIILSYVFPAPWSLRLRYNVRSPWLYAYYAVHPFCQFRKVLRGLT